MSKNNWILTGFILLKFILTYALIGRAYELHRDEFLHLDQARHLAWGYASVPPVSSWVSWLILQLGNTVFWIKFFPALFGALTIVVVWKTIKALKGSLFQLLLGATAILLSILLRINLLYQPNSLDVLCWAALLYVLVRYIQTHRNNWLYLAAVIFGIAFLNKYNIVFLLMGLLPALLLSPHRRIFTNKHLYGALLLGFFIILPNLIWQYQHNFPVFQHLNELTTTQLNKVNRADFLREQVLFFLGSVFILVAAFFALVFYPPYRPFRFLLLSFLFTMLIFLYFKAKGYYAIGIYPIYIAFGSVYLGELLKSGRRKYLRPVALMIPVLAFIPFITLAFPIKGPEYIASHPEKFKKMGLLRWEDGKDHSLPQDFADMLGWKELAAKIDTVIAQLPNPSQAILVCDNYGQAGAINYYSRNNLLKANSFNADYINWFDLDRAYHDVILVKEWDSKGIDELRPAFDTVYVAGSIINPYAREKGTTIYILQGAKVDVSDFIRQEIAARKAIED